MVEVARLGFRRARGLVKMASAQSKRGLLDDKGSLSEEACHDWSVSERLTDSMRWAAGRTRAVGQMGGSVLAGGLAHSPMEQ